MTASSKNNPLSMRTGARPLCAPANAAFLFNAADADTLVYLNALALAGVFPSSAEKIAINNLIRGLKSFGVWTQLKAFYPFFGGTSASHAINAKTPGTFNITWCGAVSHSAFGVKGDGATGYGTTGLIPSAVFGPNNNLLSAGVYINEGSFGANGQTDLGAWHLDTRDFFLSNGGTLATPGRVFSAYRTTNRQGIFYNFTDTQGWFAATRIGTTNSCWFLNGTQVYQDTFAATSSAPTAPVWVLAKNRNNIPYQPSARRYGLMFIGESIPANALGAMFMLVQAFQMALGRAVINVGFLGDGITAGDTATAMGAQEQAMVSLNASLGKPLMQTTRAATGSLVADWLPGGDNFKNTLAAFDANSVRVVSIMLGHSDALAGVSVGSYAANLLKIANAFAACGLKVILNAPTYVVPGSGSWTQANVDLLGTYGAALSGLGNSTTVLRGDSMAFEHFKANPSLLGDGINPTSAGQISLGNLWAAAYQTALPLGV